MTKLELIYTIALAVAAIALLIYFLVMGIKHGWIKKLTETLNVSMRYAEDHIQGAEDKKKYVMGQIEAKCNELGIPYFLAQYVISKLIETIVKHWNVLDHR